MIDRLTVTAPFERESALLDRSYCSALFSPDERHRFALTRRFPGFTPGSGHPAFVMLNPSTATHEVSDPTVTRCAGFAKSWGFDAFVVVNLFSFRSTDPRALALNTRAEGDPQNLFSIDLAVGEASIVICAWGVGGALRGRDAAVLSLIRAGGMADKLHCLGVTKDGHPKHPLYLPATATPQPFGRQS